MDQPISDSQTVQQTTCCIAGGGPAGMMLGLLLARAGVDVTVLEKHADFLRDFRGDTIHPSTLQLMHELGFLECFLQRPHQKVERLYAQIGKTRIALADFSHVPTKAKFIAFMPQWEFLNFLAEQGAKLPHFHLHMQHEVTGLLRSGERVTGVQVNTPDGPRTVQADLTIGADGRQSLVRQNADMAVTNLGAPMDVLWFRLAKKPSDPVETFGHAEAGRMMIMLNRGDYWQCAYIIEKDGYAQVRDKGLEALRTDIAAMSPFVQQRVDDLRDWDQIKLLTVSVDRLEKWHSPGLLCIGDAAHAMSPIGGVGINLAIQDAVATANLLWQPLSEKSLSESNLQAVQQRRMFPTKMTQDMQVFIQNRVITRLLNATNELQAPWFIRLLLKIPAVRWLPAWFIGVGVRAEHIKSPHHPD